MITGLFKKAAEAFTNHCTASPLEKIATAILAGDKEALLKSNEKFVACCDQTDKSLSVHWKALVKAVIEKDGLGLAVAQEMADYAYHNTAICTSFETAANDMQGAIAIGKMEAAFAAGDKDALLKSNENFVACCNHEDEAHALRWKAWVKAVIEKDGLGLDVAQEMVDYVHTHSDSNTTLETAVNDMQGAIAIGKMEAAFAAGNKDALLKSNEKFVWVCNNNDEALSARWKDLVKAVAKKEGLGLDIAEEMADYVYTRSNRNTTLEWVAKDIQGSLSFEKIGAASIEKDAEAFENRCLDFVGKWDLAEAGEVRRFLGWINEASAIFGRDRAISTLKKVSLAVSKNGEEESELGRSLLNVLAIAEQPRVPRRAIRSNGRFLAASGAKQ